jgi:FkbM family methyltransferase
MAGRLTSSAFIRRAREAGWLDGQELKVLDIGASGDLDPFWDQFRPQLRAVGVDPLVPETERLNAAETDPLIRYVEAWVGTGMPADFPAGARTLFGQTSARRAQVAAQRNYVQAIFNSGAPLAYSEHHITLDQLVAQGMPPDPDVIKIDVDSFESFVLEGAAATLGGGGVVLVECECVLHELIGAPWRCFADVDTLLRRAGFRLLDLASYRYTRSTLPGRFAYGMQAQTTTGQVQSCDAVWFQDPSVDEAALERLRAHPGKLAKLVMLLEGYGFPDVAAAILTRLRETGLVPAAINVDAALDWLVPENPFGATTHADYLATFDADPRRFEPHGWRAAELAGRTRAMKPVAEVLNGSSWFRAYDGAELSASEGHTCIVTAPLPWSYAAALPLNTDALAPGEFVVELDMELESGAAYATLATDDLETIGEQVPVPEGHGTLRLNAPAASGFTRVLRRNGGCAEPSRMVVAGVRCLQ